MLTLWLNTENLAKVISTTVVGVLKEREPSEHSLLYPVNVLQFYLGYIAQIQSSDQLFISHNKKTETGSMGARHHNFAAATLASPCTSLQVLQG